MFTQRESLRVPCVRGLAFCVVTAGFASSAPAMPEADAPPIEGSGLACQFIRDAVLGTNSVDILVIGDSNSGYAGDGWLRGVSFGCATFGPQRMYGTPVMPFTNGPALGLGGHAAGNIIGATSSNGSGTRCLSGTEAPSAAPAALVARFSRGGGQASITGEPLDFGWFDVGQAEFTNDVASWYIAATEGGGGSTALRSGWPDASHVHRLVRGASTSAPANSHLSVTWSAPGAVSTSVVKTRDGAANDGSWRWLATETACPGVVRALGSVPWQISVAGAGSGHGVRGQAAIAMHSVYRRIVGWSVSMLGYRGGATMTGIAADIAAMSGPAGTLGHLLAEHRARQIAAGGSGRVVVFIQGGINSSDWWLGPPPAPTRRTVWSEGVESIVKDIRGAWQHEGFPMGDLAFMAMVSHQANEDDEPLRWLRPLARSVAHTIPDMDAVDVTKLVTYETMSGSPPMYAWDGPYHLTRYGFEEVGKRLVHAALCHAAPADIVPDGSVGPADLASLLGSWGLCGAQHGFVAADIDRDGCVGANDLGLLLAAWGGDGR
jgi:hypothetical protein